MIRKVLLLTATMAAFVALAATPASAQYGPDGPTLAVDKTQVAQGDSYVLSGTGFDADTTYEIGAIYDDGSSQRALPDTETTQDLGTVTTDADGAFGLQLTVDPAAALGFYDIGIDEEIVETDEGFTAIAVVRIEVIAGDATTPTNPGGDNPGGTNPGGNNPGVNDGTLPRTGSTTLPLVGAGLGLLAAGGALLFFNKRRSLI